ncbi:MAG TPA: hypothetical protein ENJ37_01165 [Deltaproteobacteria bacterium]|nr:hypothetical protein [Deltaproteobacteria bacterium]
MLILGISCFYHDSAAALLRDGRIVAASEEERFSRRKHDSGFPEKAVAFCLARAGVKAADLDYVVFYEKPLLKFERLLMTYLGTYPKGCRVFRESLLNWFGEKLWVKSIIKEKLGVPEEKILFVEHHLSHASSSFFCSPFEKAAVLTVDGVGEWATTAMGTASADWDGGGRNSVELTREIRFPHSLGLLYSAFTAFLGFEVNEGEYKVMGMAPYGEPRHVDKVWKLLDAAEDGSFRLDMSYFSYPYHRERTFTEKFERLFGEPRDPKARFVTERTSLYDDPLEPTKAEMERNQYYADVAASIQFVTEEMLLRMARSLHDATGLKDLCLAGGVALNSVANYRILAETPFERIFIQPAAGDAGGAAGAALYVHHVLLGRRRSYVMEDAYLGEEYGDEAVDAFLREEGIRHHVIEDEERLVDRVVDALAGGGVVGWYQGRFEWGPRALGNRSILANPCREEMKDVVNIKIKFREPFRPFAPSVVSGRAGEYFEFPGDIESHYPPRYMLMVAPVKREMQGAIPAVTHVDGTGRLQTVVRERNPRYHRLIERFGEATGTPVVLNTSFNLKGEPIVTTPRNAFNTFSASGMDMLVLGNRIIEKKDLDGR